MSRNADDAVLVVDKERITRLRNIMIAMEDVHGALLTFNKKALERRGIKIKTKYAQRTHSGWFPVPVADESYGSDSSHEIVLTSRQAGHGPLRLCLKEDDGHRMIWKLASTMNRFDTTSRDDMRGLSYLIEPYDKVCVRIGLTTDKDILKQFFKNRREVPEELKIINTEMKMEPVEKPGAIDAGKLEASMDTVLQAFRQLNVGNFRYVGRVPAPTMAFSFTSLNGFRYMFESNCSIGTVRDNKKTMHAWTGGHGGSETKEAAAVSRAVVGAGAGSGARTGTARGAGASRTRFPTSRAAALEREIVIVPQGEEDLEDSVPMSLIASATSHRVSVQQMAARLAALESLRESQERKRAVTETNADADDLDADIVDTAVGTPTPSWTETKTNYNQEDEEQEDPTMSLNYMLTQDNRSGSSGSSAMGSSVGSAAGDNRSDSETEDEQERRERRETIDESVAEMGLDF
jgi:hypothetical protein